MDHLRRPLEMITAHLEERGGKEEAMRKTGGAGGPIETIRIGVVEEEEEEVKEVTTIGPVEEASEMERDLAEDLTMIALHKEAMTSLRIARRIEATVIKIAREEATMKSGGLEEMTVHRAGDTTMTMDLVGRLMKTVDHAGDMTKTVDHAEDMTKTVDHVHLAGTTTEVTIALVGGVSTMTAKGEGMMTVALLLPVETKAVVVPLKMSQGTGDAEVEGRRERAGGGGGLHLKLPRAEWRRPPTRTRTDLKLSVVAAKERCKTFELNKCVE